MISVGRPARFFLSSVARIDANVLAREIAGLITGPLVTQPKMNSNYDSFVFQVADRFGFRKRIFAAALTDQNISKMNSNFARVEFHTRTPHCSENSAPVRIGAVTGRFYQRRGSDHRSHLPR